MRTKNEKKDYKFNTSPFTYKEQLKMCGLGFTIKSFLEDLFTVAISGITDKILR